MSGDGDEEEIGLLRILSPKRALADVLEEVALAGVLSGELPGGLVERLGVTVRVDVDLEIPHHALVVQLECLRRVVDRRRRRL